MTYTRVYGEMFTTIRLVNASIISHNYPFVVFIMERALKLYSHSNFQVYNTVLLTTVIMLYIKSPEFIHLITGSWYPLTNTPQVPGTTILFVSMSLALDSRYK